MLGALGRSGVRVDWGFFRALVNHSADVGGLSAGGALADGDGSAALTAVLALVSGPPAIRRHGSPRGTEAETDALVDELPPGFRRSAA